MKIALIEVAPTSGNYVAKEMAGGLGKKIKLKNNIVGRILSRCLNSLFNAPAIVLAQVAGICKEACHELKAYDTCDAGAIDKETDIAVVLSSMVDYRNEVEFIKKLKGSHPHVRVIVVGSFGAAMPEIYESAADCVIRGEPEITMQKILANGLPPEKVVCAEEPQDLNRLPMVEWGPFMKNGQYARRPFSKDLGVSIQKSRGCSMTCNYCPYSAFYGKARQYDCDYVMKTIEHYYQCGIRYFMFRDPNFGENRKDFLEFMGKLIKSKMKISWSCEARLDTFKEDEDLPLMAQAGLRYIIVGIESSDEEILRQNLRKAYKKEDAVRRVRILEKAGVIVQTNYILGFPRENEQSVRDTIAYAKQLNSMFATFHIFTPQPGTKIFEDYRSRLLDIDWEDFTYANLVWQHEKLSKEFLEKTTSDAYGEYYFRPQWMAKHLLRLLKVLF